MKNRKVLLAVASGWLLCSGVALAQERQTSPVGFSVPDGNPILGRVAFQALKCALCHRVVADPGLPKPSAQVAAPDLSFAPNTDNAALAQSIILPSHTIAYGYGQGDPEEAQKSPMLDLTEAMTVRQMIDIIAYLKSDFVPTSASPADAGNSRN